MGGFLTGDMGGGWIAPLTRDPSLSNWPIQPQQPADAPQIDEPASLPGDPNKGPVLWSRILADTPGADAADVIRKDQPPQQVAALPPQAAPQAVHKYPSGLTQQQIVTAIDLIHQYESGGQNIPQQAYSGVGINPSTGTHTGPSTAQGVDQFTNTTWAEIAPKIGVDLGRYPTAMSAPPELQDRVAAYQLAMKGTGDWAPFNPKLAAALRAAGIPVADPTLKQSWTTPFANMSPEMREVLQNQQQITQQTADQYKKMFDQYQQVASSAPPGSKERDDAIAKMRQQSHEMTEMYRQMMLHPPSEKPADGWSSFGAIAMMLGALGSKGARGHWTAALNAAGEALTAINTNNQKAYENAFKKWQTQSEMGLTLIKLENDDIKQLLDDKKLSIDEKLTQMQTLQTEMGMVKNLGDIQKQPLDAALDILQKRETAAGNMKNVVNQLQLNEAARLASADLAKDPTLNFETQLSKHLTEIQAQSKPTSAANTREAEVKQHVATMDEQWAKDHPNATQSEKEKAHWQHYQQAEGEIGAAVRQPRNQQAMALQTYIQEYTQKNGHAPSSDEIQNFAAETAMKISGARAVGTRSATLDIASNAADAIIPLVQQISDRIDRTEFPTLNSVILAAQKGTGGTDVIRFGELINSLRYLYARALSPTGQARVADLANFDSIMEQNWTKGQITAGLDQIHIDIGVERKALEKSRSEVTGQPAPAESAPPTIAPQTGAPAQSVPTVTTQQEYDALPPGARYRGPDGQMYQKGSQ